MKIDLIGPSYPFRGGISHYTTLLFKELKKKHSAKFYSFNRQYPSFLFPGKTDKDYSSIHLKDEDSQPVLDSLNPISWIRVAIRIINDKPDITILPWWVIFWVPQFLTIIVLIKLFSKTKLLFISHNVVEHEANFIKKWLSKIVLSRGDFFIVHSLEEKEKLIDLIGERNIIDTFHPTYEVFDYERISSTSARKKLQINNKWVILFFGFVREYKGLKHLLNAMPKILEELDVRLIIAGEFWDDKDNYTDLIKKLNITDNVSIFDDYIPNEAVPSFFYASDIVVLPYISVTGSGMVQLAYGFNKPVVVSNIGALSQVVKNRKTGYLVEKGNSDDIAEAVIYFFKSENKRKMRENIMKDSHRFSWDVLVRKIESFVE